MSPAGVTLNGEKPSETWTQQIYGRPGNELITKLSIKQVLLGHDAKKDEVNVVEVTTESWKKDGSNQKIPIAVLKLGETQSTAPNFEFPSVSVTFKLIAGTGPVHIAGLQFPDSFEDTLEQGEVRGRLLLYDPVLTGVLISVLYSSKHGLYSDDDDEGVHRDGDEDDDGEEDTDDDEDEDEEEEAAVKAKPSKANNGKKK